VFQESDDASAERVIVINESMARRYFPDGDAVGRRITWDTEDDADWYRIIGVVGDEHQSGLHARPLMETFVPYRQLPAVRLRLIVHTRLPVATLAPTLRAALAEVDPQLPLGDVQPLREIYGEQLGRDRILLALTGVFAVLALLLATVGIYGLMAGMVAQRTREIGIRMTLGAATSDVAGVILRHGVALTVPGIVLGLAGAWASSRLLATVLFGVAPTDPFTFLAVTVILTAAATAACALPALRAARLQPDVALRHE
jgi:predicted lysophospholipase L1 biosynthesis ABC-type transport system permease subunit